MRRIEEVRIAPSSSTGASFSFRTLLRLIRYAHCGHLYRRNRYYDPGAGRFTQEDPIGLAGGVNAYGFANGDPVSFADPYGLRADCCLDRVKKIARGVITYVKYEWRGFLAGADVTRASLDFSREGQFGGILGRFATVLPTARAAPFSRGAATLGGASGLGDLTAAEVSDPTGRRQSRTTTHSRGFRGAGDARRVKRYRLRHWPEQPCAFRRARGRASSYRPGPRNCSRST